MNTDFASGFVQKVFIEIELGLGKVDMIVSEVSQSRELLKDVVPYDPKYLPAEVLLSANENPRPLPASIQKKIRSALDELNLNRYPDPLAQSLRDLIAQSLDLDADWLLVGNGGDELLFNLAFAWGGAGRKMLTCPPTFSVYDNNAYLTETEIISIDRREGYSIDEEAVLSRAAEDDLSYIVLTSPNNPTGNLITGDFLKRLLNTTSALVLVDEAYGEFASSSYLSWVKDYKNLAVLKTFSKAYCLAGLRLGYLVANPEIIRELIKVRQPYSVDVFSQAVGEIVYRDRALLEPAISSIIDQRAWLVRELSAFNSIKVFPSQANFLLVRIPQADRVWNELYDRSILVRDFSRSRLLEDCLRITVGTPEENRRLVNALKELVK